MARRMRMSSRNMIHHGAVQSTDCVRMLLLVINQVLQYWKIFVVIQTCNVGARVSCRWTRALESFAQQTWVRPQEIARQHSESQFDMHGNN
jgi:hypothetical protein